MAEKTIFFKGLNGIRAIAALSVLFAHTTMMLGDFGLNAFIFGTYDDGNPKATLLAGLGVSMFFALSGFLITYLLLEEKKTGNISVKNFYIRRVLRIWPLYYAYMILSLLTLIKFTEQTINSTILFYIFFFFYFSFIIGTAIDFISHYWSLGVEEQFYSFWPWLIRRGGGNTLIMTVLICAGLILLKTAIRIYDIQYNNGNIGLAYSILHTTRFQCMLIGAVGAILYFQQNKWFLMLTNNYFVQSIAWLAIVLAAVNQFHIISFLDNEIFCVVTLVVIIGQIKTEKRIVNLNHPVFDFVGKISYGIYVIHPLVIFYLAKAIHFSNSQLPLNYLIIYIVVFIAVISIAYLSYKYFEKPFLSLKLKYSIVRSSSERNKH